MAAQRTIPALYAAIFVQLVLSRSETSATPDLERKTNQQDMMSYILPLNKLSPKTNMSEPGMLAYSMSIIVASSETLSAALASVINNLITHPRPMITLIHKLRSIFTSEDEYLLELTHPSRILTLCCMSGCDHVLLPG